MLLLNFFPPPKKGLAQKNICNFVAYPVNPFCNYPTIKIGRMIDEYMLTNVLIGSWVGVCGWGCGDPPPPNVYKCNFVGQLVQSTCYLLGKVTLLYCRNNEKTVLQNLKIDRRPSFVFSIVLSVFGSCILISKK